MSQQKRIKLVQTVFLGLIIIFVTVSTNLSAVEVSGDIEDLSLEELLSIEVTVASKSKETTADAPSSVSVFTALDIDRMGISNLEELLNYVPGFQTTRDVEQGTAMRISSRGRSTALSESILFLVDGMRINDLYTGGVSILNRLMAVENIKQVEIIRGPGSALYGSNAFLGVVNIVTREQENNVLASIGSFRGKSMAVNFSRKISNDMSVASFLKVFSDEGENYENVTDIYGTNSDVKDPSKGIDAYLTVKYKELTLNFRHMERDMNDFMVFGGLGNNINHESSKQTSLAASYQWVLNQRLRLDIKAGYLTEHWKTLASLIPAGTELAPDFTLAETVIGGPNLESYNGHFNLDLSWKVGISNWLSTGVSYMRTGISKVRNLFSHHPITMEYQGEIISWSGAESFNEEVSRDVIGVYVQDKIALGKHLDITAGVRLDKYSDFGSSLNPRAAVIYSTPFNAKFKVMYGRAFRAPNFLELYDKNNPVDFGNQDLEPEKVETIEFAYIQNFKKLQTAVTYFQNKISDIIVLGDVVTHPNNPLEAPRFQNAGEARTKGLELEFKSTPNSHLRISGTYTYLFKGDHPMVSKNVASLVVNYKAKQFNLNLNGIYRDTVEMLPGQKAYVLLNTALQVDLNDKLKLTGTLKNILNEDYLTVSLPLPDGVRNRGRSFNVGLMFQFR